MQKEKLEPAALEYFKTLPELLQEQLVESGVNLTTREELENYCKNVLKAGTEEE